MTPTSEFTLSGGQFIDVWNGSIEPANAISNEYAVLSIPAFWSGVSFLSSTLASMDKSVYRRLSQHAYQIEPHPLNFILEREANRNVTPMVAFETWHAHAVIHGNGYMWIERDRAGAPIGIHNLNPQSVTPFRYQGDQWYQVRGWNASTPNPVIPAADMLHLPGLGYDGMCGYPVVYLMWESIELARNGQRFASRYMNKGVQIQGAIEVPANVKQDQIEQIKAVFRQSHSGMSSDYGLPVLSGGAKLNSATIPPEQAQLLESRAFSVLDMCRILRVPPHIVYDLSRATWANAEAMGIEVVKYSLTSWVTKSEQEMTKKLLSASDQKADLWILYAVESLMRGDTATVTKQALDLTNGGLITGNEGRAMLDKPPLDDPAANQLRIPVNNPIGTTTPTAAPPIAATDATPADSTTGFAALSPVIADAVARVQTKTDKAFFAREGKDLKIWGNVFAEEQAKYAAAAIAPVAQVAAATCGKTMDTERIGQDYAASIRRRAAGLEHQSLAAIIERYTL